MQIRTLLCAAAAALVGQASLADCADVIKLSVTSSTTVLTRASLDKNASDFCNEYSEDTTSAKTAAYGASYKVLSLSMGTSNASEKSVYSRYCGANNSSAQRDDAYRQYVTSISPEAYTAYQQCGALEAGQVVFSADATDVKNAKIVVSNRRNVSSAAKVRATGTDGTTCKWEGKFSRSSLAKIPANGSATATCSRGNPGVKSTIVVVDETSTDARIAVPWSARDADGNPVDLLSTLQQKLVATESAFADFKKQMTGAVVAFNAAACPDGWAEFEPARGRFIRGIDAGATKTDPDGKRDPGTPQGDTFAAHSHTLTLPGRGGNKAFVQRNPGWGVDDADVSPTAASTNEVGGPETRPKNVALLYCSPK